MSYIDVIDGNTNINVKTILKEKYLSNVVIAGEYNVTVIDNIGNDRMINNINNMIMHITNNNGKHPGVIPKFAINGEVMFQPLMLIKGIYVFNIDTFLLDEFYPFFITKNYDAIDTAVDEIYTIEGEKDYTGKGCIKGRMIVNFNETGIYYYCSGLSNLGNMIQVI